jgi:diacylglycerol kinase
MQPFHTSAAALYLMQIFVSGFLAILFLQSGIDKIVDRRGNLEWLRGHFAKSPLSGIVLALLICITILEVAAGVLSAMGCILLLLMRDSIVAFCGALVSAVAVVALFLGQRMAKDYAGAAVLVPYFLLTLVAIYLFAQR